MKKVLFTVFAIIAFSNASFAKKQTRVKELDNSKVKTAIVLLFSSCNERQQIAIDLCKENGCGDAEAFFYGAGEWGRCMGGN